MITFLKSMAMAGMACLFTGCMASQPLTWKNDAAMDLAKGASVDVKTTCKIPDADIAFLKSDIQTKVADVLAGSPELADSYKIDVTITRYDKGNAFARFMLIGLGQMYLYGTVEVKQGTPPVVVRTGEFKKNYCVGGMIGGTATMQKDVLPKVGVAIADAIKGKQKT